MAAMVVNEPLLNIANYENEAQLRNLLKNHTNLRRLFAMGDSVAGAICVDLELALTCLTPRQQLCVRWNLMDRIPALEVARALKVDEASVRESVKSGVQRMSRALTDGTVSRLLGGGGSGSDSGGARADSNRVSPPARRSVSKEAAASIPHGESAATPKS